MPFFYATVCLLWLLRAQNMLRLDGGWCALDRDRRGLPVDPDTCTPYAELTPLSKTYVVTFRPVALAGAVLVIVGLVDILR